MRRFLSSTYESTLQPPDRWGPLLEFEGPPLPLLGVINSRADCRSACRLNPLTSPKEGGSPFVEDSGIFPPGTSSPHLKRLFRPSLPPLSGLVRERSRISFFPSSVRDAFSLLAPKCRRGCRPLGLREVFVLLSPAGPCPRFLPPSLFFGLSH